MGLFESYVDKISYEDILELDGCFSATHILYNESLQKQENNTKSNDEYGFPQKEAIKDSLENIYSFKGTKPNLKQNERIVLWKDYFKQYVYAFDSLLMSLPNSVVVIYIGRQAIELGIKYLLLLKTGKIDTTHDLLKLSKTLFFKYNIQEEYMMDIQTFCEFFSNYIEDGNVEYFKYPEYKNNTYYAGKHLDIKWLSFNIALVILKLIHFAELDNEF